MAMEAPINSTNHQASNHLSDDPSLSSPSAASGSQKTASTSSTRRHFEIPFVQLKPKVEELCLSIWSKLSEEPPKDSPASNKHAPKVLVERIFGRSDSRLVKRFRTRERSHLKVASVPNRKVLVERMRSGSYNRIVGFSLLGEDTGLDKQYVLRIPRDEWHEPRPDRDVAILKYVRQKTSVPVADVTAFDFTENNLLGSAYVIQSRIQGTDLGRHEDLSVDHWVDAATQIGHMMRSMLEVRHPWPGRIEADMKAVESDIFAIRPFEVAVPSEVKDDKGFQQCAKGILWSEERIKRLYSDPFWFLSTQFGRWRAEELFSNPESIMHEDTYKGLVDVAHEMYDCGHFDDLSNTLCHLDLRGRNIMVQIQPNNKLKVTGILDWDSAVFAPVFVGCAPPHWMWADEDDQSFDENDEREANDEPLKEQDRRVKKAWEEAVGPEFLKYTFEPQYRLARKLFHISLRGIHASCELREAEELISEWNGLQAMGEMEHISHPNECRKTSGSHGAGLAEPCTP